MTYRVDTVCLIAVGVSLLIGPSLAVADTGASDTATQDTAATDTTGRDTGGTTGDTATGDTAAADTSPTDAGDTTTGDTAEMDTTGDTGPADAADTTAPDVADTGAMDAHDALDDGDIADTEPPVARYFGAVEVRSRPDDAGVKVALEQTDGNVSRQQTTDRQGEFEFEQLPLGTYEVEFSLDKYVTLAETLELTGDRQTQYTLFRDQKVDVRVEADFSHVDEAPEEVEFKLEGERGMRTPDNGPVPVEKGAANWSVSGLGVGTWRLTASAKGFRDVTYQFNATGPDGQPEQLDLRVYLPRADVQPPAPDSSGCTCRGDSSGGGGPSPTPSPGGPLGAPLLILFSFWCSRRLLS
ncbi:MAG: carboxypeptidase regulatory-like domain-containing protein [Bradymonadaceae bacterium]